MKLTFFFLLVCMLQISVAADAQKVSLSEKNASLEKVFKRLHKTAGLNFLYDAGMLRDAKPVNVTLINLPVEDALTSIFKDQPLTFILKKNTIIVSRRQYSHEAERPAPVQEVRYTVAGTVKDNLLMPLPGVSVKVLNSNKGTVTSREGKYSIEVLATDTLEFSFIGYRKQQAPVRNKVDIDVTMEAASGSLDEVVVSGFGTTQKKVSVTGAISTIQTKELKQSPVANLSNALAGRLPGLTSIQSSGIPGSDAANIYIRGIGTYGTANKPLIVIDGLPRGDANFGDIDVNEIASISILKDAATTSLYGIQGANGVILVTTKRGSNRKTNIQFNAQYGLQQPTRLPERFNALDQALLDNEGAMNDNVSPIWTDAEIQKFRDKSDPFTYPDVDWMKVLLAPVTPQQQYNVNINGGNEKVKYFTSLGYLNQGTLLKGADNNKYDVKQRYTRLNFRSNIDIAVTKMMDVRLDLSSRLEERTGPGPDYGLIFHWASFLNANSTPVFNPDGSYGAGRLTASDARNPMGMLQNSGYYKNFWNSTNGTVQVSHRLDFITTGLSAKALYTFENYGAINTAQKQDFNSFRYRKDPETGVETYVPFSLETSLTNESSNNATRYYYYNVQLQYDRSFDKHNVSGMVLFNRNFNSSGGTFPFVYEGFVGRAAYNYDYRYFFEFNMGYNGSENFPAGKRYGFFPAVSAGWVVSSEPWYNLKAMNYLKLRGSYGEAGNDQIGGSRFLFITDYIKAGGNNFGETPQWEDGYNQNRIGNPNVTWERSFESNAGLETGFFDSQVKLEVDVFRKLRKNILTTPRTIPSFLGIPTLAPINIGQVLNKGFEASLNVNTHIKKVAVFGFVNWTYNKNKILAMDEPKLAYAYQQLTGYPIGYTLGYTALGLFQNQEEINKAPKQNFASKVIPGDIRYKDMNNDGVINEADRAAIQTSNFPNNIVGASVGAGWKGFDVSVLFQASIGGKTNFPVFGPRLLNKRWTPETAATATYPIVHKTDAANNTQLSTFFIASSDYLKLKNVEIGYSLPASLLARMKLNSLRVFVNGLNLGTWDKLPTKDYDPEQATSGALLYPLMKIYNFGVVLNF